MTERRILVDMDDVLVDFCKGSAAEFGLTRDQLEELRTPGTWNTEKFVTGLVDEESAKVEFWSRIRSVYRFWENLEPLPHMNELLSLVAKIDPNFQIVTAPPKNLKLRGWVYSGKLSWIEDHLGEEHMDRMILLRDKYMLAKQGVMLIDDREPSLVNFSRYGGSVCIFPTRGNSLYDQWKDPMAHVRQMLKIFATT